MRVSQFLIVVPVLAVVGIGFAVIAVDTWRRLRGESGLGRAYQAQFELPVLFYAGCLFAHGFRLVDEYVLGAAVMFVIAHFAQSLLQVHGSNAQGGLWARTAGLVSLGVVWSVVAAHFLVAGF